MNQDDLQRAASALADWMYGDSHVHIDDGVKDALRADFAVANRFPTDQECELLVTGDDDGGVPEELVELFPATHEYLGSFF